MRAVGIARRQQVQRHVPAQVALLEGNGSGGPEERREQVRALAMAPGFVGHVGQAVHGEGVVGMLGQHLVPQLASLVEPAGLMAGEAPRCGEAPIGSLLRSQPVIEIDDVAAPPEQEEQQSHRLPRNVVAGVPGQMGPTFAEADIEVQLAQRPHHHHLPAGPIGGGIRFGRRHAAPGRVHLALEECGERQTGVGFGTRRIDGGGGGKGVPRPGLTQQEQLGCSPVASGRVLRRRRQRQAATVAWHRARRCPLATCRPRPGRPG